MLSTGCVPDQLPGGPSPYGCPTVTCRLPWGIALWEGCEFGGLAWSGEWHQHASWLSRLIAEPLPFTACGQARLVSLTWLRLANPAPASMVRAEHETLE